MQGASLTAFQQLPFSRTPTARTATAAAVRDVKPPVKWAGGKRWLVPHLRPLWQRHRHRRLVEPFCGGLAVSLGLQPSRALANDVNPHVINFYRWLKKGFSLSLTMRNDPHAYYEYRSRFNQLVRQSKTSTRIAAELFYYLNRTGYNGLCRFNRRGEFNVPFGRYTTINYDADFTPYRRLLSAFEFGNVDFERLSLDPHDFVYADPPYDVDFTQYAKDGFTWSDQVRLAQWLLRHPGPVVLSNQATPRIVDLYSRLGFKLFTLQAPRMISCTGDRTPATEVLAVRGIEL